jgi:hypothetical protein
MGTAVAGGVVVGGDEADGDAGEDDADGGDDEDTFAGGFAVGRVLR